MKFSLRSSLALGTVIAAGSLVASSAMAHGPGRLFDRFDANNDGQITRTEAHDQAQKRFNKMDVNQDHVLTKEEIKKHHQARKADPKKREQRIAAKIRARDKNKNGKLEANETRFPERVFKRIDKNGDGSITKEEMIAAHEARRQKGKKGQGKAKGQNKRMAKGKAHFQRVDTSGDGKISAAEAKGAVDRVFSRIDKNKDNVVTRAEAKQAMRDRHGARGKDRRAKGKDGHQKHRPDRPGKRK